MSRKELEKEFRKSLILDTAKRLFTLKSFEKVTMDDVAKGGEFGKATLYQYFASKDELLVCVIVKSMDELIKDIKGCSELQDDTKVLLNRLVELQYDYYRKHSHLFISLMQRQAEGNIGAELLTPIHDKHQHKVELLANIFLKGLTKGDFALSDPLVVAKTIENVIKGFALERLEKRAGAMDTKEEMDTGDDIETIKTVLLKGILNSDLRNV